MPYLINRKRIRDNDGNLRRPWGYPDGKDWVAIKPKDVYLDFDGNDDWVDIPTLWSGWAKMTLECWIKTDSASSNAVVVGQDDSIYFQMGSNGKVNFVIHGESNDLLTSDLTDNTWYHLAAVFDGSNTKKELYVDGTSVGSDTTISSIPSSSKESAICYRDGYGYLDALVDDVRIWNSVRTPTQIQGNMNAVLSGSETGLTAYYKLDTGSGSTAYDSANSNDGSIIGATWVES